MSSKTRKRKNPFVASRPRSNPSKKRKGFDPKAAKLLAETDLGSYYHQDDLLQSANESVSASHSKISLDFPKSSSPETSKSTAENRWETINGRTIIHGEELQHQLHESVCCRFCEGDIDLVEKTNTRQGFGATWRVKCKNEECLSQVTNVEFSTSEKKKGFDINKAFVLGMRTIGRGYVAASKLCSFMGIKPINKLYWTENSKKIEKVTQDLVEEELRNAADEVKQKKKELGSNVDADSVVDIGVSLDCSWSSRGWSANDAVVAAISADTGKVVDVVHINRSCTECTKMEEKKKDGNVSRVDYLKWFIEHEPDCSLNHDGSSAAMESSGAKILYERSEKTRGLRYIPFIGDGDSKAYSAVCVAQPYGPSVFIPKEECIAHVTKRMGTGLRALVKEYKGRKLADGKQLSGAGRLTLARIDTIQNFYGRVIRDNKNDAKAMAKGTQAILMHYSSTLENPKHDYCPKGPSSWCSFQRDVANGTALHQPIKNPFPEAVVEVLQPLFDRLGDEAFLVGCEKCYTQNTNESLHHVIWGMAPKEVYTSPQEINIAINLGVLQFNQGFLKTYTQLLEKLEIDVHPEMTSAWHKIDSERLYQAGYKNSEPIKKKRKVKKKLKLKRQDAFVHQEGVSYKSQAFYGKQKSKKSATRKATTNQAPKKAAKKANTKVKARSAPKPSQNNTKTRSKRKTQKK